MLKSWQVGHFKSIVNTLDLELADITVLTGLHNSGKTSLFQSILLISQTLSSNASERTLLTDGPLFQFSTFNEVASDSSNHMLTFGFELVLEREQAASPPGTPRSSQESHSSIPSEYSVTVTVDFRLDYVHRGLSLASLDYTHQTSLPSAEGYVSLKKPSQSGSPAVESLAITLPATNATNDEIVFAARRLSKQAMGEADNLSSSQYNLISRGYDPLSHEGTLSISGRQVAHAYQMLFWHFLPGELLARSAYHHSNSASSYAAQIEEAVKGIKYFFSNRVRYLGPKRVNPPTAQLSRHGEIARAGDVGSQGEFTAAIYYAQRATAITWYNPINRTAESGMLEEVINYWLQYLEVAYSVQCKKTGLNSLNWQVVYQKGQPPRALDGHSHTVNQVLLLLVMGLLAPESSLLLIEHPELFLHQRAQGRLGDFFVSLAACHKQCLIETQSENLVTQLRYHIVREGGHDPDKYMIYFVEQDEEGSTQFTPIEISPRGNILNWPEGFFGETMLQEEQIAIEYLKLKEKEVRYQEK